MVRAEHGLVRGAAGIAVPHTSFEQQIQRDVQTVTQSIRTLPQNVGELGRCITVLLVKKKKETSGDTSDQIQEKKKKNKLDPEVAAERNQLAQTIFGRPFRELNLEQKRQVVQHQTQEAEKALEAELEQLRRDGYIEGIDYEIKRKGSP